MISHARSAWDRLHADAGHQGHRRVVGVEGLEDDDLVARLEESPERELERLAPADRGEHLGRRDVEADVLVVAGHRLAELGNPGRRRVGDVLPGIAPDPLHHDLGRGEVGLADVELVDLHALARRFLGVGRKAPDGRGLRLAAALRDVHRLPPRVLGRAFAFAFVFAFGRAFAFPRAAPQADMPPPPANTAPISATVCSRSRACTSDHTPPDRRAGIASTAVGTPIREARTARASLPSPSRIRYWSGTRAARAALRTTSSISGCARNPCSLRATQGPLPGVKPLVSLGSPTWATSITTARSGSMPKALVVAPRAPRSDWAVKTA